MSETLQQIRLKKQGKQTAGIREKWIINCTYVDVCNAVLIVFSLRVVGLEQSHKPTVPLPFHSTSSHPPPTHSSQQRVSYSIGETGVEKQVRNTSGIAKTECIVDAKKGTSNGAKKKEDGGLFGGLKGGFFNKPSNKPATKSTTTNNTSKSVPASSSSTASKNSSTSTSSSSTSSSSTATDDDIPFIRKTTQPTKR